MSGLARFPANYVLSRASPPRCKDIASCTGKAAKNVGYAAKNVGGEAKNAGDAVAKVGGAVAAVADKGIPGGQGHYCKGTHGEVHFSSDRPIPIAMEVYVPIWKSTFYDPEPPNKIPMFVQK